MPNYKVYYFNGRGRAEILRLILAHSGTQFEDVRFEQDQWPAAKATGGFPAGQVPCLEVDGKKYGQSLALARYLARETGIAGKCSVEQMKADAIVDSIMDLFNKVVARAFHAKTDEAKAAIWEEISTAVAPRIFENLDKSLQGPFFLGENLTWADLAFLDACDMFEANNVTQFMDKHPRLVELRKRVAAVPSVAAYLAKRPQTAW